MKYLLDTHAFVWLDSVPRKLSGAATSICNDVSNQLFVSMATIWEMQLKLQVGKLDLPAPISEIIDRQGVVNQVTILPIEVNHILKLGELDEHHKDPFDRILIAQALVENLAILSVDEHFAKIPYSGDLVSKILRLEFE